MWTLCRLTGEGAPPGDSGPLSPGACPEHLLLRAKLLRCLDPRQVGIHRAEWVYTLGPWAASLPASGLASGSHGLGSGVQPISRPACPFFMYLLVFFKCSHYSGLRSALRQK